MNNIPFQLQADGALMRNRAVPTGLHPLYKKWLRFYLDYCQKYRFSETERKSLDHFLRKLQEKSKQMFNNSKLLMQLYFILSSIKTEPQAAINLLYPRTL